MLGDLDIKIGSIDYKMAAQNIPHWSLAISMHEKHNWVVLALSHSSQSFYTE